jgi:hypothetical protein
MNHYKQSKQNANGNPQRKISDGPFSNLNTLRDKIGLSNAVVENTA